MCKYSFNPLRLHSFQLSELVGFLTWMWILIDLVITTSDKFWIHCRKLTCIFLWWPLDVALRKKWNNFLLKTKSRYIVCWFLLCAFFQVSFGTNNYNANMCSMLFFKWLWWHRFLSVEKFDNPGENYSCLPMCLFCDNTSGGKS